MTHYGMINWAYSLADINSVDICAVGQPPVAPFEVCVCGGLCAGFHFFHVQVQKKGWAQDL